MIQMLQVTVLLLVASMLGGELVGEVSAFTPSNPSTVGSLPVGPGGITPPGGSNMIYIMHLNRMAPVTPGTSSTIDASAWLELVDASGNTQSLPVGWGWACGGHGYQYKALTPDPYGEIQTIDFQGNITSRATWGDCSGGCVQFVNPQYCQAFHTTNASNPPVYPPPPPNEASTPGCPDGKCGDPVSMMTGIYYQDDTDIEVPDVMQIGRASCRERV